MSPRFTLASTLVSLAITLSAGPALAQLCPGLTDPCVVSSNTSVVSGTTVDIGTRGFVVGPNVTITVQGAGFFTLNAGSFTMQTGAKIVAPGASGFGGFLTFNLSGPVSMQDSSQMDVGSGNGGSIDLTTTSGNITLLGRILADASLREGLGGDVALTTTNGSISVGGLGINANGGDRFAGGGSVLLDASGDITISASVQIRGSDGGTLEVFAGNDAIVSNGTELNLRALDVEFGDGGDVCIEAGNDIQFGGSLFSNASGDGPENGGGDGGFVDFLALGDIVVSGSITSVGSADGGGGDLDLDGATVTLNGPIDLTGPGQGDGGNLFALATISVSLNGLVDVRAGLAGGSFSFGGSVDIISDGDVTIGGSADLLATGSFQAGTIDAFGCNITIQNGALLDATGPATTANAGVNTIQASGVATIGGVANATTANRVNYRTILPTVTPQAGTSPAWTVTEKPTLPCCIGCPTTTSTSTTTSTTSSSTTSTSSSTTSTTSTSIPGATTTTSTSSTTSTVTTTVTSTSSTTTSTGVTSTSSTTIVTSTTSTTATSSTSVTTTTIDGTTTTTTTTLPGGCEALSGFDVAACELATLSDDVAALTDDDLGGAKKSRGLRKRIEKSVGFFERAQLETKTKKVKRFVKRSRKKLVSFDKKLVRFTEKGFVVLGTAQGLLDQAATAEAELEAIEVSLSQQ